MRHQYFIIPGLTTEKRMLEDALESTIKGDDCFVHYHPSGKTCNEKCHQVELPVKDEGEII